VLLATGLGRPGSPVSADGGASSPSSPTAPRSPSGFHPGDLPPSPLSSDGSTASSATKAHRGGTTLEAQTVADTRRPRSQPRQTARKSTLEAHTVAHTRRPPPPPPAARKQFQAQPTVRFTGPVTAAAAYASLRTPPMGFSENECSEDDSDPSDVADGAELDEIGPLVFVCGSDTAPRSQN
jgi:hypothetical protein